MTSWASRNKGKNTLEDPAEERKSLVSFNLGVALPLGTKQIDEQNSTDKQQA